MDCYFKKDHLDRINPPNYRRTCSKDLQDVAAFGRRPLALIETAANCFVDGEPVIRYFAPRYMQKPSLRAISIRDPFICLNMT